MIDRLIDFSARHRGLVIGLVVAVALWGAYAIPRTPLDVLPDLNDKQIIVYSRWERSPDLIEDQVTYPIVTAMMGIPKVRTVRATSDFGYSFVYVIFDDDTDLYWARSQIQQYLGVVLQALPPGVRTELGPDATAVGWIFQYVLRDDTGKLSPAQLRSTQDYYVRYHLRSVPGVAEVASVGGFVTQYQVTVDPARLLAMRIPFANVVDAVRRSNVETGGRLLEFGGAEYMIRGRGYVENARDLEEAVVAGGGTAQTVRLKDVGKVAMGPEMRRAAADLDGEGEAVSGIVVMRQGSNVLDVIGGVKKKLEQIAPGLPPGVRAIPVYDRSELVHRVIHNLRSTLLEITLTVVLVILIFLWHPPSALIPIATIPLTVLAVTALFHLLGISFNAMSLSGIAIATGALVDAAIVVVEQTHNKLEEQFEGGDTERTIVEAVKEVGRPAFFALFITAVAFLPVLALEGQEGRLFRPLAYAKSLTMMTAALLAITLDPAMRLTLAGLAKRDWGTRWWGRLTNAVVGSRIRKGDRHPVNRLLMQVYQFVLVRVLDRKRAVAVAVLIGAVVTVPVYLRLGSEFIPPLDEGVLLYMPSTISSISITEAKRLLQLVDSRLKSQPEVAQVLGKVGRADTSTDTAPLSMLETIVVLKPPEQWPRKMSQQELIGKLDAAMQFPGVANSWTSPIRGRVDMLATGIRSPLGLKIQGPNLQNIQEIGARVEELLRQVQGTRGVFAERANDGRYIDVQWNRGALATAGITLEEAQSAVQNAIGGDNVTTLVQGRERYPVNVRLPREARDNLDSLREILVGGSGGSDMVPMGQLATLRVATGPAMIRDENGLPTGYVYLDLDARDPGDYIGEAKRVLAQHLNVPRGYTLLWSGQYESFQRVSRRLLQIVPLTLVLIAFLLYWNTRSAASTGLVLLAVPFSAIGAIWALYLLGYPMSPAVWVGLIALMGIDAETGVFMVLYLDLAWQKKVAQGEMRTSGDLRDAVLSGAVRRVRPKFMTVATMFLGLAPVLWSTGAGAEIMKRIAAPMVGGLFTSFLLELIVYPVIYERLKSRTLPVLTGRSPASSSAQTAL